uniref:Ribosomal protein S11 n=1 Tax=Babesia gibsoni TaxID=33632 RepID=A0A6M8NXR1_BABGI|nr:ribosomal protein S11 [Babesia gibsoni]
MKITYTESDLDICIPIDIIKNKNFELVISIILFKSNNIFITISKFKQHGDIFIFIKILKSLSCGNFKKKYYSYNKIKNTKKLSIVTLNKLINKFILFLIYKNYTHTHIIFKNNSNNKKNLLSIFIQFHLLKGLYIYTISYILAYPYNGCRLKKRKFK